MFASREIRRFIVANTVSVLTMIPGGPLSAQSFGALAGSPHDFSASGFGASSSRDGCAVCHVPQVAPRERAPEPESFGVYGAGGRPAESPGTPGRASRLCLTCHDGVAGPGHFEGPGVGTGHPIAADYDEFENRDLRSAERVENEGLPLAHDQGRARIECTSCHDPHDNRFGNFLRKPNTQSRLCLTCHGM